MKKQFEIVDIVQLKKTGGAVSGSISKLIKTKVKGSTARGAALKAHSFICKTNIPDKDKKCFYKITIKDKDTEKVYSYKVKRVYEPREVMISGNPVTFQFYNTVQSVKSAKKHITVSPNKK
jgi:hypothetical protein